MYFSIKRYKKRLISTILGIVLISSLPPLLFGINPYLQEKVWVYTLYSVQKRPINRDVFPEIYEKFVYSMTIFILALLLGLLVALFLTFFTTMLPRFIQRFIYTLLTFFESFPDLFIVVSLQVCIVSIYKRIGILIPFYNSFDDPIYLLPVLVLSIVPTIHLFKLTFLLMKEEEHKLYLTVARSLGLGRLYILLKHVFRNIISSLLQYSKMIIVFMLSNLFIVDYVFNLNGIMTLLLYTKGVVFIVTALFLALPFSILFEIADSYQDLKNQDVEEAA